jgi:PAS domain S-box-containing protein
VIQPRWIAVGREPDWRQVVRLLEAHGGALEPVADLPRCLATLDDPGARVLVDARRSDREAAALLDLARTNQEEEAFSVVAVTWRSDPDSAERLLELGARDVIGWPCSPAELCARLDNVAAARRGVELGQLLGAMFELTSDATQIVSPEGHLLMVNQAACDLFGGTQDELVGRHVREFLASDLRALADGVIQSLRGLIGQTLRQELRMQRLDGSPLEAQLTMRILQG